MAFGRRQTSGGPAAKPEFPGARRIGRNLLLLGDGRPDDTGAAARILNLALDEYSKSDGVHPETVLSTVGGLAGFAAQQAVWEGFVRTGRASKAIMMPVATKDGGTYYFGETVNQILVTTAQGELSLWRFVAGAAQKLGESNLPPLKPMFEHVARTLGSPAFGLPPTANGCGLEELPIDALRLWPRIKTILVTGGKPVLHWPLELGVAAQKAIVWASAAVPPATAAAIVMESAIAMSKVNPKTVPGGTVVE